MDIDWASSNMHCCVIKGVKKHKVTDNEKKLWVHYEQLKTILGIYITLFFVVPFLAVCFSYLANSEEIQSGIPSAIDSVLLSGLKWYAIIMPIITLFFGIWFVCCSDRVEFTDTSIKYYRWIFSKQTRNIPYNDISECVFSDGLWRHNGEYERGRRIIFFNKNKAILELELYYKICLKILLNSNNIRVRVVGDNRNLKTIDNHYNIEFKSLTYEQQTKLIKHYCKLMKSNGREANKILKLD